LHVAEHAKDDHEAQRNEAVVEVVPSVLATDNRGDTEGDCAHHLDQQVEGWSRGVLEWISNSVADNRSVVSLGTLAAESVFELNVLLGIVPRAAGVGHHDGKHRARANCS